MATCLGIQTACPSGHAIQVFDLYRKTELRTSETAWTAPSIARRRRGQSRERVARTPRHQELREKSLESTRISSLRLPKRPKEELLDSRVSTPYLMSLVCFRPFSPNTAFTRHDHSAGATVQVSLSATGTRIAPGGEDDLGSPPLGSAKV